MLAMVVVFFASGMTSCTAMLSGHVVAVRLLTRGQRTGNDRGQRCYRQRGLQDIPIVGVAVAVIAAGFQSSYISASYMANEQDICNSDLYYTEMETDLQMDIDQTDSVSTWRGHFCAAAPGCPGGRSAMPV